MESNSKQDVTILIADDDPGHQRLVIRNLRRGGLQNDILTFSTGKEILDYLENLKASHVANSTIAHGTYLLLLDIRMPDIDGVQVLSQIKSDSFLKKLPITMLTTTDDPREISNCYELGCAHYIVKPVDYEKFSETIRQLGLFFTLMRLPKV